MRILIVGATGTIGQAVVAALGTQHNLVLASQKRAAEHVDITDASSLHLLFSRIGSVDAVVNAAGQTVRKPFNELTDIDFQFAVDNKLLGQVNLVRHAMDYVKDGGSITLISGFLAQHPERGSAAVSMVNAGVEGFMRAAALEAPRGIRVNAVSPLWVTETLVAKKLPTLGSVKAAAVAQAFVRSVEGNETGQVLRPAP